MYEYFQANSYNSTLDVMHFDADDILQLYQLAKRDGHFKGNRALDNLESAARFAQSVKMQWGNKPIVVKIGT